MTVGSSLRWRSVEALGPQLSVMGFDDSTDVVIARRLADGAGLPLDVFQLDGEDCLREGVAIAKATSGVKTAVNWNTYLYSSKTGGAGVPHLVGSNGEFARTFFFDHQKMARPVAMLGSSAVPLYWAARCLRRAAKFSRFNPLLSGRLNVARRVLAAAPIDARWGAPNFLTGLDTFYSGQRVRHFIGGGLACYAAFGEPRSPFLDGRWLREVAALGRHWKMGGAYHVESTRRLQSWLIDHPYNQLPGGARRLLSPVQRVDQV